MKQMPAKNNKWLYAVFVIIIIGIGRIFNGPTEINNTQSITSKPLNSTKLYSAYGACCSRLRDLYGVSGFHCVHDECIDYGNGGYLIVGTAYVDGRDKRWVADIKEDGDSWKLSYPISVTWQ